MPPLQHSILGASSAHRWMNCPGSVRMSRGIPRSTSKYAEEGTAAHELGEMCLTQNVPAVDYLGGNINNPGGSTFEVTEEMAQAVQIYLDTVRKDQALLPDSEISIERKFNLDWLYPGLFGTNDACLGQPFGKLAVYDYKHGAGKPVKVEENVQLMYYGLGAIHNETYEEVELIVVQPRIYGSTPVKRWSLPADELSAWGEEVLKPAAIATEAEDAKLESGDWCGFCPAGASCPARRDAAMLEATKVFGDTPVPQEVQLPDPRALTADEVDEMKTKIAMFMGIISPYAKSLDAHMLELMRLGEDFPNWKQVAGRKSRKWSDEVAAQSFFESKYSQDAMVNPKLKSVAQMEKVIKSHGDNTVDTLDGLVAITQGTSLVPASDKRIALSIVTGADVFKD